VFELAPTDRTGGPPRPRIVVIFTGGTIAMLPDPATGAAVPALRGEELLARLPDASTAADLEVIDWGLVPASHLRFTQVIDIATHIRAAAARADVSGIVVVQGTDVLEETAFAWDLLHGAEPPVVVVGAMRNAGQADYDGGRNLADAIRVAADPWMRGQGVVVVMDGLVLPADDATKMHSQALDAFQAPNAGALGRIVAGRLALERERGHRRRIMAWPERAAEPIALLTAVVSTDGDLLRAASRGGVAGLVVEATGSGNTDPDLLAAAVEAMAVGIPVVLATRCPAGGVGPFYGFPGGGRSWQEAGALLAGSLSGPKARMAVALGLGAGLDRAALAALLAGHERA
jgi:L-asparaginase